MELIIPAHCLQTPCMGPFPLGCLMNKNLKIGSVTGREARTAYLSFFFLFFEKSYLPSASKEPLSCRMDRSTTEKSLALDRHHHTTHTH
jgi:hypothetical protein